MAPRVKSIEDLRRELQARENQLGKLEARRQKLLKRLGRVDREIAAAGGEARTGNGRRRGRPPGKPGKPGRPGRRRRATGTPLPQYIQQVLAKCSEGMRAKDIAAAVTKAGYKSHSKDFYGIVAATLRDESAFKRVSRGVYKLK